MNAFLYLEDGTELVGEAFGARTTCISELVFNTGMTGYQEVLTDPSYHGQAVVMTYPMIGNYGINPHDFESDRIHLKALVVREHSEAPSHYLSTSTLDAYLAVHGIPGVAGVDTRMLTKRIRRQGTMPCLIAHEPVSDAMEQLRAFAMPRDLALRASTSAKAVLPGSGIRVGLLDLGHKRGMVRELQRLGCEVVIYPYGVETAELLGDDLDALLLSNGPGDPKDNGHHVRLVKSLFGQLPLWGICLGHQILALALGADTFKMKFGHRGSNHPVLYLPTNKVFISSQNHGYAVEPGSMGRHMHQTYVNVNDHTVEGFDCPAYRVRAVQFHPEEGPGPLDGHRILAEWVSSVKEAM